MKVATFNVNSIRVRLQSVLTWLEKESPDVLCLQETKVIDSDFPAQAFHDMDYSPVFRGEKTYNGVALLTRLPVERAQIGFTDDEAEGTRLITAVIQGVPIVNTYIPQGYEPQSEKFRYKLDWFRRLYDYFDRNFSAQKPLLWVGDFNVAPEAMDVHDPGKMLGQVGYHPDEHAALERIRKWGFVDVFRMHQQGREQYSFWDYRVKNAVQRKKGWRIDHIWATKPLADKSIQAWIDKELRLTERPSDHAPVVAEFAL